MGKKLKCINLLILFITATIFILLFSCGKSGDSIKDNNKVVVPIADSIEVFPGYKRVKIKWKVTDPNIERAVVYNGTDSLEASFNSSSEMEVDFHNLTEGNQIFYIYQYDKKGRISRGEEVTANIYGDHFIESLKGRPINSIIYSNGDLKIEWKSAPKNSYTTTIEYRDNENKQHSITIGNQDEKSVLSAYKIGTNFKYKTAYLPSENSLDTLASLYTEIGSLDFSNMTIDWDNSSLSTLAVFGGYCRVIQLDNSNLLSVYEKFGEIFSVNSTDRGETWSKPIKVVMKNEKYNMTTPSILELKNGSILVAYSPRPLDGESQNPDPATHYSINLIRSNDGGNTWIDNKVLYEAGSKSKEGCWEPDMVQLPNGEIQLFFSNEKPYNNSDEQEIALLRSNDNGISWTTNAQRVSFRKNHRDGMPVPLVLPESNQILVSIEDNSDGNFKPYIIRNTFQENWQTTVEVDNAHREYALTERLPANVYAGAPFLIQFRNALTILSFQSTKGRSSQWDLSCMNVAVGNAEGKNFTNTTIPFKIANDKYGLWNSLCVMDDGTVLAVTTTNAYNSSGWQEVKTIKGRLKFLYSVK